MVTEKLIDSNVTSLNDLRRPQDGDWLLSTETSNCYGSVTHDQHDSNLAGLQPPQRAWSNRKLSILRKKLQALLKPGKTERSKMLPIVKPKDEIIRPPMPKAASSQHDSPPRAPTLKKRSTRRLPVIAKNAKRHLDKQELRGYISEKRQLESSQHNIDVDSHEATSQLFLTSEEHKDTTESPSKTRQSVSIDQQKGNDDDSRTDYVVDKWQRIFKERQKERSRRRSRADRTDSFGLIQSRQPPGDGTSESDHYNPLDGVAEDQFYGEGELHRISTWPPYRGITGELDGDTVPKAMGAQRIPLRRVHTFAGGASFPPVAEIPQSLGQKASELSILRARPPPSSRQIDRTVNANLKQGSLENYELQINATNYRRPERHIEKDEEVIEAKIRALKAELRSIKYEEKLEELQQKASQYKEGRSADHPRTASTSPDEHSLSRRGRRRNSSLVRKRAPLVQSNKPVSYGNAPIRSAPVPSRSSVSVSSDSDSTQEVTPSPHGRQKRQTIIVSPPRSPSTSSDRSYSPKLESSTNPLASSVPPKSILREPRAWFPEEIDPFREGIAPVRSAQGGRDHIPPNARWTKIDRLLVNPEALDAGNERYEERPDYVIVLRVLTREEIELYALKTQDIRGRLLFKSVFERFD